MLEDGFGSKCFHPFANKIKYSCVGIGIGFGFGNPGSFLFSVEKKSQKILS